MLFDEDYRSNSCSSSTTTTTITSTSSSSSLSSPSFSSSFSDTMFFLTSPNKFYNSNTLDDSLVSEKREMKQSFGLNSIDVLRFA